MNKSIRAISVIGLILMFSLLFAAASLNYFSQVNLQHSRELVIKSNDLIMQLKTIISTIKDCETGQRGYVITGDPNYLEPYEKCHSTVYSLINKFESTLDNDAQDQCRRLKELASIKLDELKQTIELRRNYGFVAAQKLIITNAGKTTMDQIRQLVGEMEHKQDVLLKQRLNNLKDQFNLSSLYAITFVLVGCILGIGTLVWIGRIVSKREKEIVLINTQYDITHLLSNSSNTNDSITKVLGMMCKSLNWDFGAFWLLDEGRKNLKCAALWRKEDWSASEFEVLTRSEVLPIGYGLPGRIFASQQTEWVKDINELSFRVNAANKEKINTGLGIPVSFANKRLGIIEFFSKEKKEANQELIRLAESLSSQIASYVERQEAQKALVERESTLSTILNTAAEGIFALSDSGTIESANAATCDIFNYERGGLIGKSVRSILPELDDMLNKSKGINRDGIHGTDIEMTAIRSNGSELPVELSYSITKLNGRTIITGIVRDITERKVMERRVSEFYSTVSHELRTPLTSIRGSLSLIDGGRAGDLSPRAQQLIKVARSESERLIRLINEILDIKKIESGKLDLKPEIVEVEGLVNEAIEALYGYAEQAGVKITLKIDKTGLVHCDKDRIEQVIGNLISNAIKFSNAGQEVVLTVSQAKSGDWHFAVKDHGQGISDDEMPKLFGLFQQLDPSDSRKKGGTGLGLAICKALVEKHNGFIGVESKAGHGSTFWFELPDLEILSKSRIRKSSPNLVGKNKSTVLIVEDDPKLANLLAMVLEDQGFTTVQAGSIKEAEQFMAKGDPDALVLDLTLPDGDGLILMEKLEQRNSKSVIPVIIVSGREPNHACYSYPLLIDWIKKPFDEKRLLSAVGLAMKKRPKGQAKVLIVEDDASTREVIKQNLESLQIEFIEAEDGITAVYYARSKDPDLIMLDLGLPSLDGFEVVQILRKEKLQNTPLIVYTAKDLSEAEKKELTLGLTLHMTKSRTSEEELLDTVKKMLNGLLDHNKTAV
jgi:PAS domain S-box-containing protein